jgi:hypothetical protein
MSALEDYLIKYSNGKIQFFHEWGDDLEMECLTPGMIVRRSCLNGDGTFGKLSWIRSKEDSKFELEVRAVSDECKQWLKKLAALAEHTYQKMWETKLFKRSSEYFSQRAQMPPQVRGKAIPMIREHKLKFRRSLKMGPAEIRDNDLCELNDIDNEKEHVAVGDTVRVQFTLFPYVLPGEKKFGISLRLNGVTLVQKAIPVEQFDIRREYKGANYLDACE